MLSLYVPVLSDDYLTEEFMKSIFLKKELGIVDHVDFVKNLEKNRNEAFIHFSKWFDTDKVKNFQKDVKDKNIKTKVYYTENKFIPVLENTNPNKEGENPKYIPVKTQEIKEILSIKFNTARIIKESEKLAQKNEKKNRKEFYKTINKTLEVY